MIIHSDWHIHSEASYDSALSLAEIELKSKSYGFEKVGITDHANYNDEKFLSDLETSVKIVTDLKKTNPNVILGVELTPIAKPEYDYIAKCGTRDGFAAPSSDTPYEIELACTKEQLVSMGVQYAIGASHWRTDVAKNDFDPLDLDGAVKEWYRQQLWLACDERVTILGHPWYHGKSLWYEDFDIIPRSMKLEVAAALKENGKYAECNSHFFVSPKTSEKFKRQYAEFLKEWHELGIPITYGSDAHNEYSEKHILTDKYLTLAGFADGDIVPLSDRDLWIL